MRALALCFLLGVSIVYGQRVGIGTSTPDPTARLEVHDTKRGILLPRLTVSQRDNIPSPAHGLLIVNIDSFTIEMFDSVSKRWVVVADTFGCAPPCTPQPSGTQPPEGIAVGIRNIHHSARLHLEITTKGILLPMLSYAQRSSIVSPAPYLIIARSDTLKVEIFDGAKWVTLFTQKRCVTPCIQPPSGTNPDTAGIGIGMNVPHPSAILQVIDSGRGVLFPRLTIAQRQVIPSPAHGLIIVETDSLCLEIFDSVRNRWMILSCPNCLIPACGINFTVPVWTCIGDTVSIVAHGCSQSHKYEWIIPTGWNYYFGQTKDSLFIIVSADTSRFKVKECIWCGCSPYDSVLITGQTQPFSITTTQSPPNPVCPIDTVIIHASADGGVTSWQWTVPSSWTALGSTTADSIIVIPPNAGASGTFWVKACNPCGCDSIQHTVNVQNIILNPTISGPTKLCSGQPATWHLNPGGATSWTWQYPPSWTVVTIGGDSITLIPDATDGYIKVTVTDGCAIGQDSLFVRSDICHSFCLAIVGPYTVDDLWGVVEAPNGDLIVAGEYGGASGGGNQDVFLARISSDGNSLLLTRRYRGTQQDYGYTIVQAPDGGYLIGGETGSWPYYDAIVIKLDANLNTQWIKRVGRFVSEETEVIRGLAVMPSGKIVYSGYRYGNSTGGWDRGIVGMLDASGNLIWGKTIAGGQLIQLYDVAVHGNNIYIAGLVRNGPLGNQDGLLLNFDTLGNLRWAKALGSGTDDNSIGLVALPDGSVVVEATAYGVNGGDAIVYRIDPGGNLIWARRVYVGGGFDFAEDVAYTSDDGIVITGGTESAGAGSRDGWVFKLDTAGNYLWGRAIGSSATDWTHRVTTFTGNYITIVGMTNSFGSGTPNMYVVKLRPDGTLSCSTGCQVTTVGTATNWTSIANYSPSVSNFGSSGNISLSTATGGTLLKICP
ncbi:MAG: hypothetical protein GXO48_02310 [Chlorobi bacterium]|nr:hypothetical protein [Chlorobiota bacterium]